MPLTEQPELTPRQQQILQLLQAGKVNKEVARELDIGLGTVKQHIVAIFKKLKVKNRTAAVSRHFDLSQLAATPAVQTQASPSRIHASALLTRRPCVVLSMSIGKAASPDLVATFYATLASAAATHEAIFLTRQGSAGEVIFGVERVTEYDVALAIQTAYRVTQSLNRMQPGCLSQVRGCLSAGLALASMHRFGGWTGEAIASAAIASARELLESTPNGVFTCDQATNDLCSAFGVAGYAEMLEGVGFDRLATMQWHGMRRIFPLVGRNAELARLRSAVQSSLSASTLQLIEGEMGMGKTRLCQELLQLCQNNKMSVRQFRGLPSVMGSGVCDLGQGVTGDVAIVTELLLDTSPQCAHVVILDDFQHIGHEQQLALMALAIAPSIRHRLIVFAGRKGLSRLAPKDTPCIFLHRLALRDMKQLVRDALDMPRGAQRTQIVDGIMNTALGVPLFAVEMAKYPNATDLSLSLRVAVFSRIDKLHLDYSLLAFIARQPAGVTLASVAEGLQDDISALERQVERALTSGVLVRGVDDTLVFTHPMIRCAIDNLNMEQQLAAQL